MQPVKILLVPGHDDEFGGAQYGNIKEADMNLALATQIYNIFKKDKRFKVYITRDYSGYTKEFKDYFSDMSLISSFEEKAKKNMQAEVEAGTFIEKAGAPHATAKKGMALRLYGFNKWANENKIDAMIHIHFNDYVRLRKEGTGKYKGFAVYMPDPQMPNANTSDAFASSIFKELSKKYLTSNFGKEKGGLISDQKLIALGAYDTLESSVRSVLVEYGYIYEKKFRTYALRKKAYASMAQLTSAGIKNYFFSQ